jgi:hypothetical protein
LENQGLVADHEQFRFEIAATANDVTEDGETRDEDRAHRWILAQ